MSIKESIDVNVFLSEIWQQRSYVIKQGFNVNHFPLTVNEMMGLASEEEVESRLVEQQTDGRYVLTHGPFTSKQLETLGKYPWSLLIQALDHWSEDIFQLFEQIDFIPFWRTDDMMVSISSSGGSVGPHFDYYDVFLIQLQGRKTWRIGSTLSQGSKKNNIEMDETSGLKLLSTFEEKEIVKAVPGDVLYLPPNVPHWGVAEVNDEALSVTLSIGFRAPSHSEVLEYFAAEVGETLSEGDRFTDRCPNYASSGEIPAWVHNQLKAVIEDKLLSDPALLRRWLGKYLTLPRDEFYREGEESEVSLIDQHATLIRAPGARLAFSRINKWSVDLFVNGDCMEIKGDKACELIYYLCNRLRYRASELSALNMCDQTHALLTHLFKQQIIVVPLVDETFD